ACNTRTLAASGRPSLYHAPTSSPSRVLRRCSSSRPHAGLGATSSAHAPRRCVSRYATADETASHITHMIAGITADRRTRRRFVIARNETTGRRSAFLLPVRGLPGPVGPRPPSGASLPNPFCSILGSRIPCFVRRVEADRHRRRIALEAFGFSLRI